MPSKSYPDPDAGLAPPPKRAKQRKRTSKRRVDILQVELSNKRISPDAYRAGRHIQRILEQASQIPGTEAQWRERIDSVSRPGDSERLMLTLAENARTLNKRIDKRIGVFGRRFLTQILAGEHGFLEAGQQHGLSGERAKRVAAWLFRCLLEELGTARQEEVP